MTTKFYIYNEVDSATITATSQNLQFPIANLKDDRRTKVFRTNNPSDIILFDFGGFKPIDSFCMVGHTVNGFTLTGLTIQFNNTNVWTSPPVSIVVPIDYENNIAIHQFATSSPWRYARMVMTSTALGYCEVPKVFIGLSSSYPETDFSYPLQYQVNNLSTITKNRFGQKFIDEIATQKIIKGKIDYIPRENIDDFINFLSLISKTKPFFINFDNGQMSLDINKFNGYYYLADEPTLNLVSGNFWSLDMTLEEAN